MKSDLNRQYKYESLRNHIGALMLDIKFKLKELEYEELVEVKNSLQEIYNEIKNV